MVFNFLINSIFFPFSLVAYFFSTSGYSTVLVNMIDFLQAINDLDFHPESPILISAAKDSTIRYILDVYTLCC